ncbi:uncharacterized protein N0V89_002159 [Didymosphaeria variabile]|uniref:Aminoglycoside phosphotransferase domain-containing protein n=1 Tax=Didymosphaeria variabile TaxID=1932322 RepID=A0A9W8XSZ5_9PLEO|nr:uncharacterized protein N0V89_002159 [Didymosphaeria variabile]KAJ4357583.1 hypothetical protein N0V89_002159 [Didymosphaeria variabile]
MSPRQWRWLHQPQKSSAVASPVQAELLPAIETSFDKYDSFSASSEAVADKNLTEIPESSKAKSSPSQNRKNSCTEPSVLVGSRNDTSSISSNGAVYVNLRNKARGNEKRKRKRKSTIYPNRPLVRKILNLLRINKANVVRLKFEVLKAFMTKNDNPEDQADDLQDVTSDSDAETTTDNQNSRKDWDTIRSISDDQFRRLVLKCFKEPNEDPIPVDLCQVFERREGGFHLVAIMYIYRHEMVQKWLIRVPAHGTTGLWTKEDEYMMGREVEIVRHIRHNTTVPVPNIKAFYTGLDDEFGAPWVLMEMLPGRDAYDIWFDAPYDSDTAYLRADTPSSETHRRRVNFLKSLAAHMAKLQCLQFDRIGMAKMTSVYDVHDLTESGQLKAVIGPSYHWPCPSDTSKVIERGPFTTIQDYVKLGYDNYFDNERLIEKYPGRTHEFWDMIVGIRKILDIVFSTPVFNTYATSETYAIRHNDLDLQNILTDEDGNVTGIIDWDGAVVGPRCIGPAAAPRFLMRDWSWDKHGKKLEISPHMAWNTEYYRDIYAAAMHVAERKTGLSSDAKYTSNSALYHAACSSLYVGGAHCWDLTDRIIRSIPGVNMKPEDFKILLGRGYPAAEEMLKREVAKLFEPELPSKAIFRQLDIVLEHEKQDSKASHSGQGNSASAAGQEECGCRPQQDTSLGTNAPVTKNTPLQRNGKALVIRISQPPSSESINDYDSDNESIDFAPPSILSQNSNNEDSSPCSSCMSEDEQDFQSAPQLKRVPTLKMKIPSRGSLHPLYVAQNKSGRRFELREVIEEMDSQNTTELVPLNGS